jgi:tRNA U34 5-methylaminomethyl-2-thiouridine-forming methyltransferase MnmC
MSSKIEIRRTADGSPTLFVPELDETYHSMHGSVQEAKHVFIDHGLRTFSCEKKISVLEVGFGTGLNALLSAQYAIENQIPLIYTGIEAFPVGSELWSELCYVNQTDWQHFYQKMMQSEWEQALQLHEMFTLTKMKIQIQDWPAKYNFDLIYYDAFGPRAQAEMWESIIFEKLYKSLSAGGSLVTYCAQGAFKRKLKEIGFQVEALPGPPGKREMTRARKINN